MNNVKDNTEKPLVSFIVTCYNLPSELIDECLESILGLSLRDNEREIVVIDDGSEPAAIDGIVSHANDIIYVRQRNAGLSAARNMGLQVASGEYIQFVDGDDKLITDAYDRCLDIIRYNSPDIVLFDFADKETVRQVYDIPEATDGSQYMRHNNLHASACGYVFKRNILHDLRFTQGLLHEDEEFTPLLILRAEKIYSTNIVAYFYRKRPSSIMHEKNKKHILKRLDDLEYIIMHLNEKAALLPLNDRNALQRRVAQLTMDYIFNIIKLTRSSKQLDMRIERLKDKGLFPLPDNYYTKKYTVFRLLSKNKMLRRLACRAFQIADL